MAWVTPPPIRSLRRRLRVDKKDSPDKEACPSGRNKGFFSLPRKNGLRAK